MKWAKYLAIGLMALIVLVAGGLYAAISFIDQTKINSLITEQVESATGRTITISGDISPTFSLMPTVEINQITLGNAAWGKAEYIAQAETLSLALNIMPLLQGDIQVSEIALSGVTLFLEQKGKQQNWQFVQKQKQVASAETITNDAIPEAPVTSNTGDDFSIAKLAVQDGTIHYSDLTKNENYTLLISSLDVEDLSQDHIGQLALQGTFQEAAIEASGQMQQELFLFDVSSRKEDASLNAKGSLALSDLTFDATLNANSPSVSQLASLVGAQQNDNAPISLNASLGGQFDLISISKLTANYDGTEIQGNGKLNLKSSPPYVQAALSIDEIKPASNKTQTSETGPTGTSTETTTAEEDRLIPKAPLPVDTLSSANADITMQIASLQAGNFHLKDVFATLALKDKVLRITEFRSALKDGTLNGTASLDGAKDPATFSANLNAKAIPLESAIIGQATDIKGGLLNSSLSLNGMGTTLRDVLASSNGDYHLYLENASYVSPPTLAQGADFFAMLRGGTKEEKGAIDIECAVADFDIKNGVATSNALAIKTDAAIADGGGTINLKDETMRLGLRGRSQLIGFADVVPPLVVAGPIQNPSVTLDAQQNLLDIGKFALGAVTGVGLIPILGEKVTDKLGITADNNPCLKSIAQAQQDAANANADPKNAYKNAEDNVRVIRDDIKDNVKGSIKDAEKDIKVIRDGLKGLFKKSE